MNQNFYVTDFVILVTGLCGSGKSTFINALLDKKDRMPVGHKLRPCTTKVDCAIIDPIPGYPEAGSRRLVVVDTPGFDNTYDNDTKILREIVDWIEERWPDKVLLGGVIYLHEIHKDRFVTMTGTDLNLLRHSFGESDEALRKVVLATTKWKRVARDQGDFRVDQLQNTYWKTLIERGSKVQQFSDNYESAWKIVDILLKYIGDDPTYLDVKEKSAEFRKLQLSTQGKPSNAREQFVRFLGLFGRNFAFSSRRR